MTALSSLSRSGEAGHEPHLCSGQAHGRHTRRCGSRSSGSAAQTLVGLLGARLGRGPPGLVVAIPLDCLGEPGADVLVLRGPSRLGPKLAGVDGVAHVMAGAVGYEVEPVG